MIEGAVVSRWFGVSRMVLWAALTLVSAALALAAPRLPAEAGAKPDFSTVQTAAAAKALVAKGKLVPILLFPAEFGGEAIPENMIYITPGAAAARELLIGTLTRLIKEGSIDKMEVEPSYKGRSFIPTAIRMKAWHSSKPGSFEPTIRVW
ncbi:hypothetical protein [Sphingobium sp. TKS]|uniref:hypothetical protein n=2 Tax=unclassified Sphingobium TaxID=2611147 RepID=UPI000770082B|nr:MULTISPECIES: hypothetical protein [Sphingomonadaceae]AMK21483.1 hypothetical protein K426_02630 [Sphingobium sp. TKS]